MAATGDFRRGAAHALAGLRLLARPRLRRFVFVPLAINLVVFGLAIAWLAGIADLVVERADAMLPDWLDWLRYIVWPVFVAAVLLVGFYSFTIVANVIGAPFNGILAERVEDLLDPTARRPPSPPFATELVRAPLAELGKLARFALVAVPLLLRFVVPVLSVVAPLLWFFFSAWTLALEYLDYPMGNHGIAFATQRRHLRRRRALTLGFGATVLAMTLVPVLNFVAMPAAVAGATRLWSQELSRDLAATP